MVSESEAGPPTRRRAGLVTATAERRPEPRSDGPSMSVETVHFDRTRAIIRVTGDLDRATAAPLWAVLQGHISAGRRFLRVDLSGVTFLDAAALSALTRTHQELLTTRGTLIITGVRSVVARVLRRTGLDEVLFIGGPRSDDDTFGFADIS